MGGHSDNRGYLAVKNSLPDIFRLAHGEGGAFVLKGFSLVLGQPGFHNTFPLGRVVGLGFHGGVNSFQNFFVDFSAAGAAKGGLGVATPTSKTGGTNGAKAKFGTLVDTCSKKLPDYAVCGCFQYL